jgi:hypothetical protein
LAFGAHELVKRQDEEDTEYPTCLDKCTSSALDSLLAPPLCAITNQDESENEADILNAYACMCTDKIYISTVFKCVLKSCGSAVPAAFQSFYGMCKYQSGTTFPEPEKFLSAVGITTTLTASGLMPSGYTTNSVFPALTATTWAKVTSNGFGPDPTEYSAFWATATATSDDGAVSFGKSAATTTAAGSQGTSDAAAVSDGAAVSAAESGSGASGSRFVGGAMAAVVAGVAGLVVFL